MNTDESELTLFGRSDEYGRLRPSCTVGPTTTHSGTCGAPVARKRARRVREAARGNPPVETPAGHPGPTSHRSTRRRCPPRATDTGAQSSRLRGRSQDEDHTSTTGLVERPLLGNGHGGCGRRPGETTGGNAGRAPRVDLTGHGQVVVVTGDDLGGPDRLPVRAHDRLNVPAEGPVFAGVPGMDRRACRAGGGVGAAVGAEHLAVQDHVRPALRRRPVAAPRAGPGPGRTARSTTSSR